MNAFHYDSYLLPDLSTLSASTPSLPVGDSMEYPRVPGGYGEEAGKRERERERNVIVDRKHHTSPLYT